MIASFGVYMIMLFIVDLVIIIQKKYKQEKRTHNIKIYGRKLKVYKEVIEAKMQVIERSGPGADEHALGNEEEHEGGKKEKPDKSEWTEMKMLEEDLIMA